MLFEQKSFNLNTSMLKMCKYLFSILFTLSFCFLQGQTNIIPNPSFEQYISCPTASGQVDSCKNWKNFGNSPDYFNGCAAAGGMSVPNNGIDFQYAHTGVGMTGEVMFVNSKVDSLPNYREYIGVKLLNALLIGQKYYLSFFINFSNYTPSNAIACNKIGMRFSTNPSDSSHHCKINNFANLRTDSIYKDTINWLKISGSFIADSAYKYVAIGNFFDDAHTDTVSTGSMHWAADAAYYFIDDVCVTTDSVYNVTWTGINAVGNENNLINIFPNPASDLLNFKVDELMEEVQLINNLGLVIYSSLINNYFFQISVLNIPTGNFIIKIKTKNGFFLSKINIIH